MEIAPNRSTAFELRMDRSETRWTAFSPAAREGCGTDHAGVEIQQSMWRLNQERPAVLCPIPRNSAMIGGSAAERRKPEIGRMECPARLQRQQPILLATSSQWLI